MPCLPVRRSCAGIAAAMLAAAAFWACPVPAHAAGAQLVVAQSSDVLTLDPSRDASTIGQNIFVNVFDQLIEIRNDGTVVPKLAASWESSRDATEWTFTLRTDARFHDGKPVTADDVLFTFRKVMGDVKSSLRSYLTKVKAVEQVGPNRIRFSLTAPFAPFDRQVALISILPRQAYEAAGPEKFSVAPIGSGPFKVVRWAKDSEVRLDANEQYWGGAPKVKTLVFKPVPSESSRAAALASGELDVVPALPPNLVPRMEATSGVKVDKVVSGRTVYLGYNVTNPVLADLKLRQAIDHAIDRGAIANSLLRGMGKPSGQPVAPSTFGYDPAIAPARHDEALARKLLKESAYKGEKIVFQYPNNRLASGESVAQAVAGYLKAIGINVEMQGMEFTAYFPLWTGHKLAGLYMYGFNPTLMDPDLMLNLMYEKGGHGYMAHPELEQLIQAQRAEGDAGKRKAILGRIWRLSAEQVMYSPLYDEVQAYGVRQGLKWSPPRNELMRFHAAEVGAR